MPSIAQGLVLIFVAVVAYFIGKANGWSEGFYDCLAWLRGEKKST